MEGFVSIINLDKKSFAVKHEDDSYSVVEFLESTNLSVGDSVTAQYTTGDVFVQNLTRNVYFEGYIHYLAISEKEMKKHLGLN